ncbi:(Dimethylallyl)adenosine tRNA methylthiotransferase MiaB [candidate division SR1 bacterium Aalborg_AAW-1]|nr:(Dimethylallyl)adenosine tRNA methylthiotransferase MiaB [candidate division SR1 bacterium Aalborg_AAW-1]
MKFTTIVFGCQMNYSDTARIKSVLQNCHWEYVDTVDDADVVIFDTCSVRQKSEDKVTGKLMEIPPEKKVWITGCMIQHNLRNTVVHKKTKGKSVKGLMGVGNFVGTVQTIDPDIIGLSNMEIEEFRPKPGAEDNVIYINNAFNPMFHNIHKSWKNVELFFRIDDTGFLPLMMKRIGYEVTYDGELTNEYTSILPEGATTLHTSQKKTAFVPISTGCNQFCAYCIVPYARGMEKNMKSDQILSEVQHHIDSGIQEITLLGQIVNKYPDFDKLCDDIFALPGDLKRLRYTSPYPTFYSDQLLSLHEKQERMCPHIHMPLQSGSTAVLKKMFRGYDREQYIEFVDKIRNLKRDISLTTDIIVGFTDETEEDFQQTLSLVEYARFDMIYIGIYSVRPGTYAARKYVDNIPKEIKHDRWNRLNELLKKISAENNAKEIGNIRTVMLTKKEILSSSKVQYTGYTDNQKQIKIMYNGDQSSAPWLGSFVQAKITDSKQFLLVGDVLV